MKSSEIIQILSHFPTLLKYFTGISTTDNINDLKEDEFTIINTE